jgi:hypothetical protein
MIVSDELLVDHDGVPILTDVVPPEVEPGEHPDNRLLAMSVEDVIQTILTSHSFRQQLDELSASVTRQVREQLEQLLRPAIEQAITDAMDDSSQAGDSIRHQLETALPAIISRQLREIGIDSNN